MQACIFVDGENLRYSIVDLFYGIFDRTDYLPKKADWERFFDYLANQSYQSERLRTYWYVVQNLDFKPYDLERLKKDPPKLISLLSKNPISKERIDKAPDKNPEAISIADELISEMQKTRNRFDGWHIIQDGIASKHSAVEFRRAGSIKYNLHEREYGDEKGVDVKLAVDLLELRNSYDVAIIVSGDQDYVPAIQAIKDSGKRVVNVSFLTRNGQTLPGGARRLNLITDKKLLVEYNEMKQFLNI